jgi:dihydroorotate dehydrogenase electron transfer subunit
MNTPRITTIQTTTQENPTITTLTFTDPHPIQPGQFYMIWIPDIDEIPMSVSLITPTTKAITFRTIGDATNALAHLKPGDTIGLRGPYGNGFTLTATNPLFVAGGTGGAMLAPAIEHLQQHHIPTTIIIGAKTASDLFFEHRFTKAGARLLISTDDGTKGYHGVASDYAHQTLKNNTFDALYTCGPEPMMKALLSHSKNIFFEASIERYMKCAIGLCGQCCIGDGIRVCADGPIFSGETLRQIPDFGVFKRDATGQKTYFSHP